MFLKFFLTTLKRGNEINLNNIFYLTWYIQNIITSTYNQYKKVLRYLLFNRKSLESSMYLHLHHVSVWTSHIQVLGARWPQVYSIVLE